MRRDLTVGAADPPPAPPGGPPTAAELLAGPLAGAAGVLDPLAVPATPARPVAGGGGQEHTPDRATAGPRPDPESGS